MSTYRIRCNNCNNNFCSSCKVEPYHLGKTCQQYEKERNQKKCRFCQANVKNQRQNYCSKKQCKTMARTVCSEFLEGCGHPCYGSARETQHPACLHNDCVEKNEDPTLGENADSYCSICYV